LIQLVILQVKELSSTHIECVPNRLLKSLSKMKIKRQGGYCIELNETIKLRSLSLLNINKLCFEYGKCLPRVSFNSTSAAMIL
jgi:hypothetical protein